MKTNYSRLILIFASVFLMLLNGCNKNTSFEKSPSLLPSNISNSQNSTDEVIDALKNISKHDCPKNYNINRINLYYTGTFTKHTYILNIFNDNIGTFHHALSVPDKIEISQGGFGSDDEIYHDYYDGMLIRYYRVSGKILNIHITNSMYKIENNICVGNTKDEVLKYFKNNTEMNRHQTNEYYYLLMYYEGGGYGYSFYFDENNLLKKIQIGYHGFGP
jgi:hypothetical protein